MHLKCMNRRVYCFQYDCSNTAPHLDSSTWHFGLWWVDELWLEMSSWGNINVVAQTLESSPLDHYHDSFPWGPSHWGQMTNCELPFELRQMKKQQQRVYSRRKIERPPHRIHGTKNFPRECTFWLTEPLTWIYDDFSGPFSQIWKHVTVKPLRPGLKESLVTVLSQPRPVSFNRNLVSFWRVLWLEDIKPSLDILQHGSLKEFWHLSK